MRSGFEFKLLGPLEVSAGGCVVPIKAAKQRVVLASLLVDTGRVVTVDQLVARLWGNAVPDGAQGTVRAYVMRLRQALDTTAATGPILTCAEGYCIDLSGHVLDLHCFEALVRQAKDATAEGRSDRASELLADALGLWRGEALSNVPSEVLHREILPRLAEQWLLARELRIDAALAVGRHRDMTAELGELTTQHPLREGFWAQRMLALYRSSRQAEALDCYHTLSALLVGKLGIDPGPELRSLHQAILTNDPCLRSRATATSELFVTAGRGKKRARPVLDGAMNLTGDWRAAQDLELLERERELRALDSLIMAAGRGSGQLVTVQGAAGVGKTRLLTAARAKAQRAGLRVLVARGSELERNVCLRRGASAIRAGLGRYGPGPAQRSARRCCPAGRDALRPSRRHRNRRGYVIRLASWIVLGDGESGANSLDAGRRRSALVGWAFAAFLDLPHAAVGRVAAAGGSGLAAR